MGGHPSKLDVPRVRGTQGRLRNGRTVSGFLDRILARLGKYLEDDIMATPEFGTTLRQDDINITGAAGEQLVKLFEEVDDDDEIQAIRIFVAGGGCSGMTYGMTFTDRQSPYDKVLNADGYQVYVDAVALGYLKGVEIDYVARDTGASFVFNNVFQATGGSGVCGACGAAGGGCG